MQMNSTSAWVCFCGHENTSGGAAPNCFLDRIAATDAASNAFVAEWGQPAEKTELVFIRWGAFLTDPLEGKKLTGTILDAVSRMLATYADLKGLCHHGLFCCVTWTGISSNYPSVTLTRILW